MVIIRLQTERATDRTDAPYKPLASSRQDKEVKCPFTVYACFRISPSCPHIPRTYVVKTLSE